MDWSVSTFVIKWYFMWKVNNQKLNFFATFYLQIHTTFFFFISWLRRYHLKFIVNCLWRFFFYMQTKKFASACLNIVNHGDEFWYLNFHFKWRGCVYGFFIRFPLQLITIKDCIFYILLKMFSIYIFLHMIMSYLLYLLSVFIY